MVHAHDKEDHTLMFIIRQEFGCCEFFKPEDSILIGRNNDYVSCVYNESPVHTKGTHVSFKLYLPQVPVTSESSRWRKGKGELVMLRVNEELSSVAREAYALELLRAFERVARRVNCSEARAPHIHGPTRVLGKNGYAQDKESTYIKDLSKP
jgi:hypothetical protein